MPASPSPPCQCPISDTAKLIMRRATPPWLRKLPASMKNGIAMISKLSRPVNSFIDTDSIGTPVRMNRNVSTVRPSAIETGMPVTMNAISRMNSSSARSDLRQHDHAGLVRDAERDDEDRREDQRPLQRIRPAARHDAVRAFGRVQGVGRLRRPRHALRCGAADVRSSSTTRPPAGSGSTSARSRPGWRDRSSTSAIRGRTTAGRSCTFRRRR